MSSMRLLTAAAVFLLSAPAVTLAAQANDPDRSVAGGGTFPAGWNVRTEPNRQTGQPAPLANVKFTNMGPGGMHTTVGPAAIYWRDRDTISGNYHVVAKLIQILHDGPSLTDCGCTLRLIHRSALKQIGDRFTVGGSHFLPEMVILALKCGLRVIEVPVNYRGRVGDSKITGTLRGTLRTGARMIGLVFRYRVT